MGSKIDRQPMHTMTDIIRKNPVGLSFTDIIAVTPSMTVSEI